MNAGIATFAVAVVTVMGAVAADSASRRRQLGEGYARAFSDQAHNVRVVWSDSACTFIETTAEQSPSSVSANVVTVIWAAKVKSSVQSRAARPGALEVTFRCDPAALPCVARTRRLGSVVAGTDWRSDHVMTMPGSASDVPRVVGELAELRSACAVSEDAGR